MISCDAIYSGCRVVSAVCVLLSLLSLSLFADEAIPPKNSDPGNVAASLPRGGANTERSPNRVSVSLALPRGSEAATFRGPSTKSAHESLPLITPLNFDPADPGEYSRRNGIVSPGSVATGRIWNRPLPRIRSGQRPGAAIAPVISAKARAAELLPAFGPQTRQLGKSVLGLPIVGHFFGVTGPKTLIFAAIHGDEPNTAFVANQLVEHLTKNPSAYFARRVVVVPVVNPDGLARGTRINAREIDLNRNFPAKNFAVGKKGRYFGGEQPASEPESQLLIQLIDDWQPDRIITMHAITRGKHGNNFDGPAEELAKTMSGHNEYSVLKSIGYPTPGSFGSWAGIDRQVPTITLELPSDAAGPVAWRENREALLSAIQAK